MLTAFAVVALWLAHAPVSIGQPELEPVVPISMTPPQSAEDAEELAKVDLWAECAMRAAVDASSPSATLAQVARIARISCAHLWPGPAGADDRLYLNAAQAAKHGQDVDVSMPRPISPAGKQ